MAGILRVAVCGLVAVLLGWVSCAICAAQDGAARPEVVPAPAPSDAPLTDRSRPPAYGPLQAGQDAYQMAEQQRRWAVERQAQLIQSAWIYHPWFYPYVPSVSQVYGYVPPRALRRAYRHGYWAVPQAWPQVSIGVYRYPYATWAGHPTGYQQIWIGPNSYVNGPYYGERAGRPSVPTPATPLSPSSPSGRPAAPAEQPSGPILKAPIRAAPESIPAPPAVPAPGDS